MEGLTELGNPDLLYQSAQMMFLLRDQITLETERLENYKITRCIPNLDEVIIP